VITLTTLKAKAPCRELVSQAEVVWSNKQTAIELDAGDVLVLEL
jgi:hypothetical protein